MSPKRLIAFCIEVIPSCILFVSKFNELNLDLIWCAHADFNHNSKRVIDKCGFNYKFTKCVKRKLLDNQEVNTLYYNLAKSEYLSK